MKCFAFGPLKVQVNYLTISINLRVPSSHEKQAIRFLQGYLQASLHIILLQIPTCYYKSTLYQLGCHQTIRSFIGRYQINIQIYVYYTVLGAWANQRLKMPHHSWTTTFLGATHCLTLVLLLDLLATVNIWARSYGSHGSEARDVMCFSLFTF